MDHYEEYTIIEETKIVAVAGHAVIAVLHYNLGLVGASLSKVNNFLIWAITTGRLPQDGSIMVKNLICYIQEYAELYAKLKQQQ